MDQKANTRRFRVLAFLLLAFLFRFIFGLYCPPVTAPDDYVQTYAIGLKAYTTYTWPYYGPDVQQPESDFKTQIPGALEGLLIALPLSIWPVPESPTLFLNLLTFLSLTFLGWYFCKRLPGFSPWLILIWLYIAPWNTHYSTQVINPSYAVPGSVLFFLGFLESTSYFRLGVIPEVWANLMMGFGLAWVMQLHMSWVAMVPFLLVSIYSQWKKGAWVPGFLQVIAGSIPPLCLVMPTYWVYGFSNHKDVHGFVSGIRWDHALDIVGTMARYLSIASFEMPRFVAEHTRERLNYFLQTPWLMIPGLFLWGAGLLQPFLMLIIGVVKEHPRKDWAKAKILGFGTFWLLYGCFLFSPDMAASFRIVLFMPVIMLYSLYCWDYLAAREPYWRTLGLVFILCGVYFQIGYTYKNIQAGNSVYAQDREKLGQAIQAKDYRLLAERRPGSLY